MGKFQDDIARGCLENGEPLEALYGTGWWTHEPEQEPDYPLIIQCHKCNGSAYDLGAEIDCENCGVIPSPDCQEGEDYG